METIGNKAQGSKGLPPAAPTDMEAFARRLLRTARRERRLQIGKHIVFMTHMHRLKILLDRCFDAAEHQKKGVTEVNNVLFE